MRIARRGRLPESRAGARTDCPGRREHPARHTPTVPVRTGHVRGLARRADALRSPWSSPTRTPQGGFAARPAWSASPSGPETEGWTLRVSRPAPAPDCFATGGDVPARNAVQGRYLPCSAWGRSTNLLMGQALSVATEKETKAGATIGVDFAPWVNAICGRKARAARYRDQKCRLQAPDRRMSALDWPDGDTVALAIAPCDRHAQLLVGHALATCWSRVASKRAAAADGCESTRCRPANPLHHLL